MTDYRIGIDVGGTFTDLALLRDGAVVTKKVRSTPQDFSSAVLGGLGDLLNEEGLTGDQLGEVIHGMTVISNAIIEKKGARTGLITTKGFRDVLEFGRMTNPMGFDMSWDKPAPLVERFLRVEVRERITSSGAVFTPLHLDDVEGEKWLRKSEQGDKWNRCLIEGMIVLSETGARDEQTTPP